MRRDPEAMTNTCTAIHATAQAYDMSSLSFSGVMLNFVRYHDYTQYLAHSVNQFKNRNKSKPIAEGSLTERPQPIAMMYDNIIIHSSWINVKNITQLSQKHGSRIVLDSTMAMPHPRDFAAARDPVNKIMQPQDASVSMNLHT